MELVGPARWRPVSKNCCFWFRFGAGNDTFCSLGSCVKSALLVLYSNTRLFRQVERAKWVYERNNISLNLATTDQPESCVYEPPERCADEELPSNFIEGILSTIRLYFRSLFRYLEAKINKSN